MERNILVDKLKGYACFLVLFGHVIMGIRLAGIAIPAVFQGVELFIWSFHVALFLFLSGVVYKETGQWQGKKTKIRFILHKLLNLGVPYVVFSAVYILANSLAGETNTQLSLRDLLYIWKTPVAQYWYLYALFFMFCIWACLSGLLKNWQITLAIALLGVVLPLLGIGLGSFDVVFSAAWAFGVGTFVSFSRLHKLPLWGKCAVLLAHLGAGVALVAVGKIEAPIVKEVMMLFGIFASIQFISLVQNCKPIAKFLLFMSKYSFQTYLLHTIFTAGIRIVLLRVGIAQWWLHVILGIVGGIGCSVLAAMIAGKIWWLNLCFFPSKAYSTRKRKT